MKRAWARSYAIITLLCLPVPFCTLLRRPHRGRLPPIIAAAHPQASRPALYATRFLARPSMALAAAHPTAPAASLPIFSGTPPGKIIPCRDSAHEFRKAACRSASSPAGPRFSYRMRALRGNRMHRATCKEPPSVAAKLSLAHRESGVFLMSDGSKVAPAISILAITRYLTSDNFLRLSRYWTRECANSKISEMSH